ncbi:MAG TPA: hypothetical protein PLZ86_10110 [bacterium]|nr:hypothetical protein [bacterium]
MVIENNKLSSLTLVPSEAVSEERPPAEGFPFALESAESRCLKSFDHFVFEADGAAEFEERQKQEEASPREAALNAGTAMMDAAEKETDYETRRELLVQAGAVFTLFGLKEDAYRAHFMLIQVAEEAGRNSDAAFHRAIGFMGDGRANAVRAELEKIPEGYDGREILIDFLRAHKVAERMAATFAAVSALAAAHAASMEETESSFLGGLFKTSFDEEKGSLAHALDLWRGLL